MDKNFLLSSIIISVAVGVVAAACSNPATAKTENTVRAEWDVTVNRVIEFNDERSGINTETKYTVADTARVNAALKELKHCGNVTIGWTLPSADGTLWLVAYENEPLLAETVKVMEGNPIPSYDGEIQAVFQFRDAKQWEAITRENIGQRLAIIANGRLMNAPQVNCEITSGKCAVTMPAEKIDTFY